jgi:hypothetical protein
MTPLHLTPPPTLPASRANSHALGMTKCHPPSITYDNFQIDPALLSPTTNPHIYSIPTLHITPDSQYDETTSPNSRTDKRRRTDSQQYPRSPDAEPIRRIPTLAPIKPIGFAASREQRREEGGVIGIGLSGLSNGNGVNGTGNVERTIPSPVVMGFDFKQVDEDQLKTVGPDPTRCEKLICAGKGYNIYSRTAASSDRAEAKRSSGKHTQYTERIDI